MTTRRLFAPELPPGGGDVSLDAETRRHLRVLRLAPGAPLELFDGQGRCALGVLKDAGTCRVQKPVLAPRPMPRLTLVLGMPKAKKLDACVRAATELGVSSIHLAVASRTQQSQPKLERLTRVLREAARQSEQLHMPELLSPAPLLEVAARPPETALRWGCFAREGTGEASSSVTLEPTDVVVAVGPEGGFTPEEVRALRALDYRALSLGPGILRVETAVPVALALARARLT